MLRWWPSVLTEESRVQKWVWVVPILYVATALVVTDYTNLSDIDTNLLLTVAATSLLVGVGEELMFRGISINALRGTGMREGRVALWSSVIFGAAHITNLFTEGPSAIVQVAIVSVSGYFLYLIRRVSGTILVPIVLHAMWDFSLFSHNVGVDDPSASATQSIPIVAMLAMVAIVFVGRHKIEPEAAAA